jgi:hypothetical protein
VVYVKRGEYSTKLLESFFDVPARLCTVSLQSPTGIRHAVDVTAESLYEAAALGLAVLKQDGWIEGLGPGTKLEIPVREPGSSHIISVDRLKSWINGTTSSPVETLRKAKLKHLLM